jgi:hypothetical protein
MSSWISGLNKLLAKTQNKQKQNKQNKPKKKQVMRSASRMTIKNSGRISKFMYNPYSRFAGPLPSLAPAGKSVHLKSQLRKIESMPLGSKAIICFSNYGYSATAGMMYIKYATTTTPMKFVQLDFPRMPTPSGTSGRCFEMRPSKASIILRNLTPYFGRISSCTVIVTAQKPYVDNRLFDGNSQSEAQRSATFDLMFDQLYGRPEAMSYAFNKSEEICALPVDMAEYQTYKPPAVITPITLATLQQSSPSNVAGTPMQNVYFLLNAAQAAQDIEIDAFCSIRARYDMDAPISVMATPEQAFSPKERRIIDYVRSHTQNGGVITIPDKI